MSDDILHLRSAIVPNFTPPLYTVTTSFYGAPPPPGARFTIEGWNAVDPSTRRALPHLQVFVMGDDGTFKPDNT